MASTKPDREASEAEFHSKYGWTAGWDDAREIVHSVAKERWEDPQIRDAMLDLLDKMAATRQDKREAYLKVFRFED